MEPGQTRQQTRRLVTVTPQETRDNLTIGHVQRRGQSRLRTDLGPHPNTQPPHRTDRISETHRPPRMLHPIRGTPEIST
ncbi:hypothetical protein, partial [Streptomyces sp. NPDC051640]|uniref:hypothetical protein n=1 Tax=Streptomyces sp. NPDC051640 TaxID=3365664 RepID=UPI0037A5FF9E